MMSFYILLLRRSRQKASIRASIILSSPPVAKKVMPTARPRVLLVIDRTLCPR